MYLLKPYDDALQEILNNGVEKENRTGINALTVFGIQTRYRLDQCFPLLTGRKLSIKAMVGELLWFVSGSTNNNTLRKLGCNYWTPWVDPAFEARHGYEAGSLGPLYGFQLRSFGGNYNKGKENSGYGHGGVDQLAIMVETLKNDPNSRRNLFSLWNPKQLDQMKLPPCHMLFQVFVNEGKLSGMLTQRSCDFPVGVPFNIAFYSALLYMLAQQTGLQPYEFIHSTADSHIYVNQIDGVREYLAREKPDSPKLRLDKAENIYSYQPGDFELVDYNPQPIITIPVAV